MEITRKTKMNWNFCNFSHYTSKVNFNCRIHCML